MWSQVLSEVMVGEFAGLYQETSQRGELMEAVYRNRMKMLLISSHVVGLIQNTHV